MPEAIPANADAKGFVEVLGNTETKALAFSKFSSAVSSVHVVANGECERGTFSTQAVDGPVQFGAEGW